MKTKNTINPALQKVLSRLGLKVSTVAEWTFVRYAKGYYRRYDDKAVFCAALSNKDDFEKAGIISKEKTEFANEHWLASICLALSRMKGICPEKYRHTEPSIVDSFLERQYMYYEANAYEGDVVEQYLADIKEEEETCN